MSEGRARLVCAGCGAARDFRDPAPFRCARAGRGDDVDHVLRRTVDVTLGHFDRGDVEREDEDEDDDDDGGGGNPFIRFRELSHAWHLARDSGFGDDDFVALVRDLNERVRGVDGTLFRETPFAASRALADAVGLSEDGELWVKDETGNVAGSHKARHLMGIAVFLEVVDRLCLSNGPKGRLAIASCGNAALAAAVVARAALRPLDVFIPANVNAAVVKRLGDLGAHINVCERKPGVAGDPCVLRFREEVAKGAVPFCCQGNENGLAIDGGMTLAYEMISVLRARGETLDKLFIQVGGGALASACAQAFREAARMGFVSNVPRIHAVQTEGCAPVGRAFERVVERMRGGGSVDDAIRYAATHRAEFMWPWETEPKSEAHGILDDETYDWLAIVKGMLETGGGAVVVSEEDVREANRVARQATGINVDATGSAGLAGLLALKRRGDVGDGESVAVIFSGVERR